ncbi:MAG: ADP-ribosylglycohydrolase family protein [Desulfovibrio sp.]|nr:ADP-ribosylglycohydrolase family protein [Desulfovibrio sp.]
MFYTSGKPEAERFKATKAVSSITHAHTWSVAACFLYLEYLRNLLGGMEKKAAYAALRNDFQAGCPYIDATALEKFARILHEDITALPEQAIKSGGFVVHTLEAALWCFLTTENYRDAVLKAVNLGEDTDTTAAVTGALAGLAYGLAGIPAPWLKTLAGYNGILSIATAMT